MRKLLALTAVLFFFSALTFGAGWIDWYVDNTFEGDSQGTEEAPFKTIQEAVAASVASNATFSADTIWIKGTGKPYYGPVEIPTRIGIPQALHALLQDVPRTERRGQDVLIR